MTNPKSYPSVPAGWQTIIQSFDQFLQDFTCGAIHVADAKEKFGGLRIHMSDTSKLEDMVRLEVFGALMFAERISLHHCQQCGGTPASSKKKRGWIKTLCDECRNLEEVVSAGSSDSIREGNRDTNG